MRVLFKEICEMKSGGTPKKSNSLFYGGKIPWVTISDFKNSVNDIIYETNQYLTEDGLREINNRIFPKGTLLLAMYGSVGKTAILGVEAATNQAILGLRAKDNKILNINYLKFWLEYNQEFITSQSKGAILKNISLSIVENQSVDLPDLETQNRIVAILEKVKSIMFKREEAMRKYIELQRALFIEMFGDPVINPKKWKKNNLKKIAKLERGRFSPRPRNNPLYFGGEYPFIQTGDIANSHHRLSRFTQTLNEKGIKVSKKFTIGDIVIAIVGATIGITSILEIDVYATDSVIGIKPNKKIVNNVFLEMLLRFYKNGIVEKAPEVARANINLSILGKVECIIPPLELQEKFSLTIKKIEELKASNMQYFEETKILFKAISQLAFKGELNFNTAVDLEILLENDYTFFTKNSDKDTIELLIKRLDKNELNENKFHDQRLYDKAKEFAFELLKENKIKQVFDNDLKRVKLTV
ncbi:restriction endonuclease subunit S [Chryseobacterium sp. M5]|uniref:restriction endonuclease subunit S n=1 Tax=Chryseobacterium sp. M5 TaxID=3379128 RepID=UPI003857D4B2